jgi:Transposase (partial DDE domain)
MTSFGTISHITHIELGLVKKSACWRSKMLFQGQKKEGLRCTKAIIKLIQNQRKVFLGKIITMDKLAISLHTPENKNQSKQWLKKGTPGPVMPKAQAWWSKQMVLAFFDKKGMKNTHYAPRGKTVNTNYIIKALCTFLKVLKEKMPELCAGD